MQIHKALNQLVLSNTIHRYIPVYLAQNIITFTSFGFCLNSLLFAGDAFQFWGLLQVMKLQACLCVFMSVTFQQHAQKTVSTAAKGPKSIQQKLAEDVYMGIICSV